MNHILYDSILLDIGIHNIIIEICIHIHVLLDIGIHIIIIEIYIHIDVLYTYY